MYFTQEETDMVSFDGTGINAYWVHVSAKGFRLRVFGDRKPALAHVKKCIEEKRAEQRSS